MEILYRGTLLIRNRTPIGPYDRPMCRALPWSQGGESENEVPLNKSASLITRYPLTRVLPS